MSNRPQTQEDSDVPEPGKKFSSPLLKALRDLLAKAGLNWSDGKEAEQLIETYEDMDSRQLLDGIQSLYLKLNRFDPQQTKLAEVYASLYKIQREKTQDFQAEAPLQVTKQSSHALSPSIEDLLIPSDVRDSIRDLLKDIPQEVNDILNETYSLPNEILRIENILNSQSHWHTLQNAVKTTLAQAVQIVSYLQFLYNGIDSEYQRDLSLRSNIQDLQSELKTELITDPEKGLKKWFQTFAFCLTGWQLDRCKQLTADTMGLPSVISLVYSTASQHIIEGRFTAPEVDQMLAHLIEKLEAEKITDKLLITKLNVLHGRIYLYHLKQPDRAKDIFQKAIEFHSNYELPFAALGEFYLSQNNYEMAEELFNKGVELPPDLIDSYLGLGQLNELHENWEQAANWYDQAITIAERHDDPVPFLGKLLAPVSGSAFMRLALKLQVNQPEQALQAVDRALRLGIKGAGKYPERFVYQLKGQILATLEKPVDAARAYFECGRRFFWNEEYLTAIEMLQLAIQADPDLIENYWYLSDALRLQSFEQESDDMKIDLLNRSLECWKAGALRRLPTVQESWAYLVPALAIDYMASINPKSQVALLWQAIALTESALLNSENDYYRWAYLGRFYRNLNIEVGSEAATAKALELAPDDPLPLRERAAILANRGEFRQSLEVIEKLLSGGNPGLWEKRARAYVLFYLHRIEEALAEFSAVIEKDQNDPWTYNLRALCYRELGAIPKAIEDYERIWNLFHNSKNQDQFDLTSVAWAAYYTGRAEDAMSILEPLKKDSLLCGSAHRLLGIIYLSSGDCDRGRDTLEEGIRLTNNIRELDDLDYDFRELEAKFSTGPLSTTFFKTLQAVKESRQARRQILLEYPLTPAQELREAFTRFRVDENDNNWIRVGIQAGLARIYRAESLWLEAANLYEQLLAIEPMQGDNLPPFLEARRGLGLCADGIALMGDQAYQTNQPTEAIKNYEYALKLGRDYWNDEENKPLSARTAVLHAKLSVAVLDTGGIQSASTHLSKALELAHLTNSPNEMEILANQIEPLLRDKEHYQRFHEVINLLLEDQRKTEEFRQDANKFSESLVPPMDKSQHQQLLDELVSTFSEKREDGTLRWSQDQLEDVFTLYSMKLNRGRIENLDEGSKTLLDRFLKRAELETVSNEELASRVIAYYDLHPIDKDLSEHIEQVIQQFISNWNKDTERNDLTNKESH